jgi:DNA-binding response OmpR family regulator
MVRIIVVMDEQQERRGLLGALSNAGMNATGVADGASLYLELLKERADMVVLERDLKGESGIAVAERLRSTPGIGNLGIILLVPPNEPGQRALSLERGADICLTKPVDTAELTAYIGSLARRLDPGRHPGHPLSWHFRQSEWRLVSPSGVGIDLSHLEAAFIDIIASNAGKPVRRRDIIALAFGKDPLSYDGRRLEAVVSRLRKKVYRTYPLSQPIKVVHSIGYVFTEAIRCV